MYVCVCVRGDLLGTDVQRIRCLCIYRYAQVQACKQVSNRFYQYKLLNVSVHPHSPPLPLPPGLLGVSPSPFNCSSVNNTANTCTVLATIDSSLTLCVDFVKYPEHAERHAVPDLTIWKQVLPSEENILSCYSSQCTSSASTGYSFTGDWGRCLHVDRVCNNILLSYSIAEVFPPKDYPSSSADIVHRTVLFNIQGELPVCVQGHQWTRVYWCVQIGLVI